MKKIYCLFYILLIFLLSACAFSIKKTDEVVLLSEGTDTPVSIIDYKHFDNDYFLSAGDKVAVISPSALPSKKQYEATLSGLEGLGYIPVSGKYVCVEERTLANCLEDLEWALNDPEIKAVFCVRGGTASWEVLDRMSLSLIKDAAKPIVGFSDITTYLSAWTCADLPSFHSSMASAFIDLPSECAEAEKKMISGDIPVYRCAGSEYDITGEAQGILIGGNLATLTAVINTAYDCTVIDEPYILFLEDVNEDYEHIHRFISILEHHGVLDKAAGLIFGQWIEYPAECETYSGNSRGGRFTSVADMISREFLADKKIPVAFGFPAGHGDINYPLLMGAKLRLEVSDDSYTLEWLNSSE